MFNRILYLIIIPSLTGIGLYIWELGNRVQGWVLPVFRSSSLLTCLNVESIVKNSVCLSKFHSTAMSSKASQLVILASHWFNWRSWYRLPSEACAESKRFIIVLLCFNIISTFLRFGVKRFILRARLRHTQSFVWQRGWSEMKKGTANLILLLRQNLPPMAEH